MSDTTAAVHHDPKEKSSTFTFIIEHLDPELGPWSILEYRAIAAECHRFGNRFILSSVSSGDLVAVAEAAGLGGIGEVQVEVEGRGVEELFPVGRGGEDEGGLERKGKGRICLLDPRAERELSPGDGEMFGGFLFGGILGMKLCFLFSSSLSSSFFFVLWLWLRGVRLRWKDDVDFVDR